MKKLFTILAVTFIYTAATAQDGGPKNVIKINPLGAIFGSANLAYERVVGSKTSVVIAPSFGFFKSGGYKYTTYGLGSEFRLYLSNSKSAPEGFYVAPGAAYFGGKAKYEDETTSEKVSVNGFSLKGIFGNQWVWNSGFTLDLNAGIQYFNLNGKTNDDPTFSGFSGILPALGFSIGYSF